MNAISLTQPAAPALHIPSIAERAMLATLSISVYSGRVFDRAITAEVANAHNTASDSGRYTKVTVDKAALAAITQCATAARQEHYARTAPWSDEGPRILAAAGFEAHAERMGDFARSFHSAVDRFCDRWTATVDAQRARLNGLFREQDYPDEQELRAKFSFFFSYQPLPTGPDLRVNLDATQLAAVRAQIDTHTASAVAAAMRDTWSRVYAVVSHAAERLRLYNPDSADGRTAHPFRDSLIANVREIAALLPSLNVTADPALADLARQITTGLAQHEPQHLRDSPGARLNAIAQCDELLRAMAGFVPAE